MRRLAETAVKAIVAWRQSDEVRTHRRLMTKVAAYIEGGPQRLSSSREVVAAQGTARHATVKAPENEASSAEAAAGLQQRLGPTRSEDNRRGWACSRTAQRRHTVRPARGCGTRQFIDRGVTLRWPAVGGGSTQRRGHGSDARVWRLSAEVYSAHGKGYAGHLMRQQLVGVAAQDTTAAARRPTWRLNCEGQADKGLRRLGGCLTHDVSHSRG